MTKLEREACRRIATAIRAYAETRSWSLNRVAREWGMHSATLDTMVGSGVRPAAAAIPRGATLQMIAQKTGHSLDWLLGLDDHEYRDQTRTVADLERDVAAHVKRALDALDVPSMLGERNEWVVYGYRVLQMAVVHALKQAGRMYVPSVDPDATVGLHMLPNLPDSEPAITPSPRKTKRASSKRRKS